MKRHSMLFAQIQQLSTPKDFHDQGPACQVRRAAAHAAAARERVCRQSRWRMVRGFWFALRVSADSRSSLRATKHRRARRLTCGVACRSGAAIHATGTSPSPWRSAIIRSPPNWTLRLRMPPALVGPRPSPQSRCKVARLRLALLSKLNVCLLASCRSERVLGRRDWHLLKKEEKRDLLWRASAIDGGGARECKYLENYPFNEEREGFQSPAGNAER